MKVRLQFYQPVHHACHQNPGVPLCSLPSCLALIKVATVQSSNSIDFFFLRVSVFYVNGLIQDVFFCAGFLSFSIVGGSSVLSHVIVSHSFSLFYNVLQCEYGFPGSSDSKETACNAEDPGLIAKIPWRREPLPSPVFLPGESHGQRSLGGCSPWDHKELDTTERLTPV